MVATIRALTGSAPRAYVGDSASSDAVRTRTRAEETTRVFRPVHVTTARRLQEAVSLGRDNIVVMLGGTPDLHGLDDWLIWWGANLGSSSEELCAGRVARVRGDLAPARARAKAAAGWVMDACLLRKGIR